MIKSDHVLSGRAAVLAAVERHPYARHVIARDAEPMGYRLAGATAWVLAADRPAGSALGAAHPVLEFFADLVSCGELGYGQWIHLPRASHAAVAARLPVARHDEWYFQWTTVPPPHRPAEERVERLTEADHPALTELIDESFPTTTARPGDPRIVDWYGIRDGDRLVAAGADRSRGDVGFLAGLTVASDRRGRGLGAALTAGMTRALFERYDAVALGVYTHNVGAIRLYEGLGFTAKLSRSSVQLA